MECLCGSICCHGCDALAMHDEPHCPECKAKWPDDFSPDQVAFSKAWAEKRKAGAVKELEHLRGLLQKCETKWVPYLDPFAYEIRAALADSKARDSAADREASPALPTNLLRSASDLRQLCAADPVAPHPHVGQVAELMEQAAGEIESARRLLGNCLDAIESLDVGELGYVESHDQHGIPTCWPIRNELADKIRAALNTQSIGGSNV